jgi:hypothetical protein
MSRKVLWGIVVGALVVAGYLYWVSDGQHTNLAVGDCVAVAGSGQLDVVDCSAGAGIYRILAEYDGSDSNQCDGVSGTVKSFVISQSGSGGLVLCAGAPK